MIKRKTNRRHMIGDRHAQTAGSATLLVRAMDGIHAHAHARGRTVVEIATEVAHALNIYEPGAADLIAGCAKRGRLR